MYISLAHLCILMFVNILVWLYAQIRSTHTDLSRRHPKSGPGKQWCLHPIGPESELTRRQRSLWNLHATWLCVWYHIYISICIDIIQTQCIHIYIYAVDIDIPELTNLTWSIRTKTPTNEVQGDARRWSLVCGERIASMQIWEMPICLYTFGWSNVTQQFIWLHIFVGWFNFWILATPMIWPCSSSTRDKGQGGL